MMLFGELYLQWLVCEGTKRDHFDAYIPELMYLLKYSVFGN